MEADQADEDLIASAHSIIRDIMKRTEINQTQLAQRMGKSRSHISRLLNDSRDMKLSTLDAIFLAMDSLVGLTVVYNDPKDD